MKQKKNWVAWPLLIIGLVLTIFSALYVKSNVERTGKDEFDYSCKEISIAIINRLHAHAQVLRSGAALFNTLDTVTREKWKTFIETSKIHYNLPGIQGTGFSLIIPGGNLQQHIQKIRREGFPEYTIRPEGRRETYTSIVFLEPLSGTNLRAFGYDMFSEPVRREAMERARDMDVAALSGKVMLVQETGTDIQAGNLMYVPVYRKGAETNTVEQRRNAIKGWVYSPYRTNNLMMGILKEWDNYKNNKFYLHIFDGTECTPESLLFESHKPEGQTASENIRFSLNIPVDFNGHQWTLVFTQRAEPVFYEYIIVWTILFGGILISILLFLFIRYIISSKYRTQQLAEKLTLELKERKLAEENIRKAKNEAEKANMAKSEFLANMSHEIRTPMNAVLGYTELLGSTEINQTQKDYISSIKSSGKSLLTLINDILDLSKIEAGKLELEFDYIDTTAFFSEFERIFSFKTTEKGLKFILDIASGTPAGIYIDETRMRQIVFNLIGNAVKFTSGGYIKLRVLTRNHRTETYSKGRTKEFIELDIEVHDTGIGISKQLQDAIFEPFVQGQNNKRFGGTGLGLTITRRLVMLMNGTISVKSKPGKGTTFIVTIPEIPYLRDFSGTKTDVQIDPAEILFDKAVILVADDVEHNRNYIRDVLKNTRLKIFEADDGFAAYEMAKKIVPDLIIADIRMPNMDGFGLLNKIKTDKKLKHIPVIAYSASVLKDQRERIHNSEFAGLLIKPVNISELYLELMNVLPYKSVKEAAHDKSLPEIDLIKQITDLPGLIHSLETDYSATWKTFAVNQPIEDIRNFGVNLVQLGSDHNAGLITGYGNDLIQAADSFNIKSILNLIKRYPGIIEGHKGVKA